MATITVLNTNNSGAGSLRQAIADASAGDTIVFDSTLAGGVIELESELLISKALTITGPVDNDGAPDLTLDGGTSNSRAGCRCVHATASVTLNNLVIANGLVSYTMQDPSAPHDYTNTTNEYGGGFFADYAAAGSSVATLNNCEITHCNIIGLTSCVHANAYGINVAAYGGTLTMTDCKISGEYSSTERFGATGNGYAIYGGFRGVVYARNATVNMTRVINTCVHDDDGGYNYVYQFYGFNFDNSNASLNSVNNRGKGLYIAGGSLSLSNTNAGWYFSTWGMAASMLGDSTGIGGFPDVEPAGFSALAISGYNFLGVLHCQPYDYDVEDVYGGVGMVTGSGYVAGWNMNIDRNHANEPTDLFGNSVDVMYTSTHPDAQYFSGDEAGLKWLPNGQTLLEKQVNNSWQKLTIEDYEEKMVWDNPGESWGGLSTYPVFAGVPYVADPSWNYIPDDPANPTDWLVDPNTPLIPNPAVPIIGGSILNPNEPENYAAYAIETEHTTTYRVWDGFSFLTYTVQGEDPPEPDVKFKYRWILDNWSLDNYRDSDDDNNNSPDNNQETNND